MSLAAVKKLSLFSIHFNSLYLTNDDPLERFENATDQVQFFIQGTRCFCEFWVGDLVGLYVYLRISLVISPLISCKIKLSTFLTFSYHCVDFFLRFMPTSNIRLEKVEVI